MPTPSSCDGPNGPLRTRHRPILRTAAGWNPTGHTAREYIEWRPAAARPPRRLWRNARGCATSPRRRVPPTAAPRPMRRPCEPDAGARRMPRIPHTTVRAQRHSRYRISSANWRVPVPCGWMNLRVPVSRNRECIGFANGSAGDRRLLLKLVSIFIDHGIINIIA